MRILALTWKYPWDHTSGGAERYLIEVCRRWAQDGHQVTIFGPRDPGAHGIHAASHLDVLPYIGSGSRLTVFRASRRYLRANGYLYDRVLETVSTRPFAAHRVVGERAVVLYHQTAEEVWNMEFPLPIALLGRHLLEPRWIRTLRSAQVVANSPSTAEAVERFGLRCIAVVPPGCDAPETVHARPAPASSPKLLWIGRMVRTKRPEDAISAFTLIRNRFPSATLDVVGDGYLRARLGAEMRPGVTIHGSLSEAGKRSLLAQADLLLLPGTREGWGIVAMEAASYGVPVIAYDVAGLRDAVVDGVTGVLVPPNSGALAAAVCQLLSEPQIWRRFSAAARERAVTYSWDQCAQDLLRCVSAAPATSTSQRAGTPPRTAPPAHTDLRSGESASPQRLGRSRGSSAGDKLAGPLGGAQAGRGDRG